MFLLFELKKTKLLRVYLHILVKLNANSSETCFLHFLLALTFTHNRSRAPSAFLVLNNYHLSVQSLRAHILQNQTQIFSVNWIFFSFAVFNLLCFVSLIPFISISFHH